MIATLKPRHVLLVLDNCEHLIDACAQLVDALLRACPQLWILATSREVLGIAGEVGRRVPSLSVLPAEASLRAHEVQAYAAVQLLVDRARAHVPEFAVSDRSAAAISEICQRLDGMPLALELAAPLLQVMSVEEIAARLDQRFRLLTRGSRAAPPRQQTLWATIDWSYQLLSEAERLLFMRQSVFGGRWTLESAEEVCAAEDLSSDLIAELILRLVDKSLLVAEEDERGRHRFRMLETLREYAQERLHASGNSDALLRRHANYNLMLARRAEAELNQARQAEWIQRVWTEQTDLLAALDWFVNRGEVQQALELAGVLAHVWQVRGYLKEGRRRLAELIELPGAAPPTLARARVLDGAGVLALYQGDVDASRVLLKESLALYRKHQLLAGVARVLFHLGWLCHDHYRVRVARRLMREALDICRRLEDRPGEARCLNVLGMVEVGDGNVDLGQSLLEQSLQLSREVGDSWVIAWSLTNLASAVLAQAQLGKADARTADPLSEESLTIWQDLGERRHFAFSKVHLGVSAALTDDLDRAADLLDQSLSIFAELQDTGGIPICVSAWALVFSAQGKYEPALRVIGATYGRVRGTHRFYRFYASLLEARLDTLRARLGADRFEAVWAEGCAMSLETAMANVRSVDRSAQRRG